MENDQKLDPLAGTELLCSQRWMFCRQCGNGALVARGYCRRCYDRDYRDRRQFAGGRGEVLERDGWQCRACGAPTPVVHHRRPGVHRAGWLITLCPACHATVERLLRTNRYLPPLLLALWRELHPGSPWQLAIDFEGGV